MPAGFYQLEYYKPWSFFYIIHLIALILFLIGSWDVIRLWIKGKRTSIYQKLDISILAKALIFEVLLQKQLLFRSKLRWIMHMFIFWGFISLFILTFFLYLLSRFQAPYVILGKLFSIQWDDLTFLVAFWGDFAGLLLLLGLVIAIIRRLFFKTAQTNTIPLDSHILFILLILVLTGFMMEGLRLAAIPPSSENYYAFLGSTLSHWFQNIPNKSFYLSVLWTIHTLFNAILLSYLPFSKLLHIFCTPLEIIVNASEEKLRSDLN